VPSGEATNTNFIVFGLTVTGSYPRSTALEASTLTITPPVRLIVIQRISYGPFILILRNRICHIHAKKISKPRMIVRMRFNIFNSRFEIQYRKVISWRSFLLVEETGVPEKTTDRSQVTDKLYHIMLYRVHLAIGRIRTPNFSGDRH
jgi:hypothetical protein